MGKLGDNRIYNSSTTIEKSLLDYANINKPHYISLELQEHGGLRQSYVDYNTSLK
jgi:hypothetical protein